MIKKLMLMGLLLCSIFSTVSVRALTTDFKDLPESHKHRSAVVELIKRGVVAGYEDGTFRPENEITRTEFCALLARTLGYDKDLYKPKKLPFSDVSADYWGNGFISFCYEEGLINGMGDGTFAPAAKVTVEQVIKMAVCAIGVQNEDRASEGEKWYDMYIRLAEKYELTHNVVVETATNAKRSGCAQMVYNVISTGLIEAPETETEEEAEEETEDTSPDDENKTDNSAVNKEEEKELTEEEKAEIRQNEIWDKLFAEKDFSQVKTIVVDAGHNYKGKDTGARNEELDIHEEDITWQIADKLRALLEDNGYTVIMTRETGESSIANTSATDSLKARVRLAHEELADLFISIHCNIGGGSGAETYCFSTSSRAGYLAKLIQQNISKETELYDRGVKTSEFYVIKHTRMPAVLVETGFLDSERDIKIITSEKGQTQIAQAIADAVEVYAKSGIKPVTEEVQEKKTEKTEKADSDEPLGDSDDE